jgi:uncharacterized membrane protein
MDVKRTHYRLSGKAILTAIILLGTSIRLYGLLQPKTFWLDESFIYSISKLPIQDLLSGRYWDFGSHPFLYYLIEKIFSQFSLREAWLRVPSFVFSTGSIYIIYRIGYSLAGKIRVGLLSSLFFAISSYSLRFSIEAKFYSATLFFEFLSFLLFLELISRKKSSIAVLFIISSCLGFFTDYSFVWIYMSFWIILIILFVLNGISKKYRDGLPWAKLMASLIFIPLTLLPWFPRLYDVQTHTESYTRSYIATPTWNTLKQTVRSYIDFAEHPNDIASINSFSILGYNTNTLFNRMTSIFVLSILWYGLWKGKKILGSQNVLILYIVFTVPLATSYTFSQFHPIFVHYNLQIILLPLIIFIGTAAASQRRVGIIVIILYALFNLFTMRYILYSRYDDDWLAVNGARDAAELSSDDITIVYPDYLTSILLYYDERNLKVIRSRSIGITPDGNNMNLIYRDIETISPKKVCLVSDTQTYSDSRNPFIITTVEKGLNDIFESYLKAVYNQNIHITCWKRR